jgi:hypothetical protein
MFENYRATKKDLEAIGEGIKAVWQPEIDFVFKDRGLLKNVVVISYDSKFFYLWTKIRVPRLKIFTSGLSNYHAYKIPHKIRIQDEWQLGWRAGLLIEQFTKLLPKKLQKSDFKIPKISGGLLKPFFSLQKKKKVKDNPYITYESFLATIVHEFGHIYWSQHKLWWYSNKKDNIRYLKTAKQLYEKKKKVPKISLYFPAITGVNELFATCTEYWASKLFWPNHKENLDTFAKERLEELIKKEEKRDLEQEDSVLEPTRNPHDFALVFGKIILTNYPKSWPILLTKSSLITKPG